MRVVEGPLPYPNSSCAVTGREDGTLVDFQRIIDSPLPTRLHLKTEIVEEAGKLLGMVPAREVEALREAMQTLSKELDEVRETITLTAELDALVSRERTPA